jgi:hypothetical protein
MIPPEIVTCKKEEYSCRREKQLNVRARTLKKAKASEQTRKSAERDYRKGQAGEKASSKRSMAREKVLSREPRQTASKAALSSQARSAARRRTAADKSKAARKAAKTRARRK